MKNYQFSFESLKTWQKARLYAGQIYEATRAFPDDERFGLTAQIRRAAVSVCSNLAEGCGRKTPRDKANFTVNAYSSLLETVNQLVLANDLHYLNDAVYFQFREKAEELSRMITGLRDAQLRKEEWRS